MTGHGRPLCIAFHSGRWTKPLTRQLVRTRRQIPPSLPLRLDLQDDEVAVRSTASRSIAKEYCHDTATPADARRHEHSQPHRQHEAVVHPTGRSLRQILSPIPRETGTTASSGISGLPDTDP